MLSLLLELFPPGRLQATGRELTAAPYPAIHDWLQARLDRLSDMERWIGSQGLRGECVGVGLLSFFDTTTNRVPPATQVVSAFRRHFHRLWLDSMADGVPSLCQFRGASTPPGSPAPVPWTYTKSTPPPHASTPLPHVTLSNFGEVGALRLHLRRKRPEPIRKLIQDILSLLFSLKRCLLMSPLTVSLFLDPGKITFDTVIIRRSLTDLCPGRRGRPPTGQTGRHRGRHDAVRSPIFTGQQISGLFLGDKCLQLVEFQHLDARHLVPPPLALPRQRRSREVGSSGIHPVGDRLRIDPEVADDVPKVSAIRIEFEGLAAHLQLVAVRFWLWGLGAPAVAALAPQGAGLALASAVLFGGRPASRAGKGEIPTKVEA